MEVLWQLRIGAQWLVVALVAVLALRFGFVAWDNAAVDDFVPQPLERKAAELLNGAEPDEADEAEPAPAQPAAAEHVRVMLTVSYSRGPATVYINGQPMGSTAFVGEFTCQRGEELTIRIQPEKGRPVEGLRACEPGFINIAQ